MRTHKCDADFRSRLGESAPGPPVPAVNDTAIRTEHAYFDHDADVGVVGRGARVEDALVAAARAVFAITTRIEQVKSIVPVEIAFEEADPEFALVTWLNQLIAHSQERGLALGEFTLAREGDAWIGEAWGEPWREGLERGTDVKGATLTMLSVKPVPGGWEARCVVDV